MQKLLFLTAILTASLISCKKETNTDANNPGPETTTWKFISMSITSTGSVETGLAGIKTKTTTSTSFTTTDNKGTVTFDGDTMTYNGVSYKYNSTVKTEVFVAGLKTSSVDLPVSYTYPATNAAFGYKKIGADSLYFTSAITTGINATGSVTTAPAGARLKWEGDQMTMTVIAEENKTDALTVTNNKTVTVTTLQKQ